MGTTNDMLTTEYDGCGNCLVATRRLSRKTDKTSSPERQADQDIQAAIDNGGHIIAWADDWEVSGATDPLKRPGLGPWLRGEMGPYDGLVGPTVDRVGRNVRDVLNTQVMLTEQDRKIITADHAGVWDFSDPNQENEWLMKAWGSQMELRAIQKRNREETVRAREKGQPKQRPSYGYMYVRLTPMGKIDHVAHDEIAAEIIRKVAERILSDETGKITPATEAARLTREEIPSPLDRIAQQYGRPVKGRVWTGKTVMHILTSEAALGYLMHKGRPVIGEDGRPIRIAEPLWDRATHEKLIEKTRPKREVNRAPKGTHLLSGVAFCGNCGAKLAINGQRKGIDPYAYGCIGRVRGIPSSQDCKPAPTMGASGMHEAVEKWFLGQYGAGEFMRRIYDPGTAHSSQLKELDANRKRLRADRQAGLYDTPEESEWYRTEYKKLSDEIAELRKLPERKPGMRDVATGRTVAQEWSEGDAARKRELLAEFEVRVVLHPTGRGKRIAMTGIEPVKEIKMRA